MTDIELINGKYLLGQASSPADTRRIYEDRAVVRTIKTAGDLALIVGVVADGVGSTQGSIAAQRAVDIVLQSLQESNLTDIPQMIELAMKAANRAVFEDNQRDDTDNYTTLVVSVVNNERLFVGNVGDSRIYWITQAGRILQLTMDHNYYNLHGGDPNSEEAERVVNYIGKKTGIDVDLGLYLEKDDPSQPYKMGLKGLPLKEGDTILLCSDGLTKKSPDGERYATDHEIVEAVQTEIMPDAAATKLVGITIGRKVDDNVSIVTIQYLTPEIIGKVKALSKRAQVMAWAIKAGVALGVVGLLITAFILYSNWRKTNQKLALVENLPMATSIIVLITNTPLPSATPTLPLEPGKAQVAGLRGQVNYDDGGDLVGLFLHQEIAPGAALNSGADGGAFIEFGDPGGSRSYAYLFDNSLVSMDFDVILKPQLLAGNFYIQPGSGKAEVHLPNHMNAVAYVEDAVDGSSGRMLVQTDGANIWIWCLEGLCRLENEQGVSNRISADTKRLYHTITDAYDPEVPITYDELWAWQVACDLSCLADFVTPPTATPTLTPTFKPMATDTPEPSGGGHQPASTSTPIATVTNTPWIPTNTPPIPTTTPSPTDTPKHPTRTPTPSKTIAPSPTSTSTPTETPSEAPTDTPDVPPPTDEPPTPGLTAVPSQCNDGIDNDEDGEIDCNDHGCDFPHSHKCNPDDNDESDQRNLNEGLKISPKVIPVNWLIYGLYGPFGEGQNIP